MAWCQTGKSTEVIEPKSSQALPNCSQNKKNMVSKKSLTYECLLLLFPPSLELGVARLACDLVCQKNTMPKNSGSVWPKSCDLPHLQVKTHPNL